MIFFRFSAFGSIFLRTCEIPIEIVQDSAKIAMEFSKKKYSVILWKKLKKLPTFVTKNYGIFDVGGVALRGARSAADAATATLEYQYLVYASSFSSCHCSSDHIVYHLSFIIFQLFPRCCIFCILGGSTGWFSGFFSTSTPKVRWDSKGAMGCQSDRSLQELSNEY